MPKVEIEFDSEFGTEDLLPKPLGRLMLGPYVGRLVLLPDGCLALGIDERAITEGYVRTYRAPSEDEVALTGFGAKSDAAAG